VATLGGQCMDFPATNATASTLLDWFWTEVRPLPNAFTECNENISFFTLIGCFKMLVRVECDHLLVKKLALSCDASILTDVPDDINRIAKRLMKNWWTNYGLPYCMQKIEEENRISFATMHFEERRCIAI
jgi:hypothetical protein